jgi:hypothetical protein
MDDWRTGQVLVELAARERNEWIEGAHERYGAEPGLVEFACECSADGCASTISMTHDEYEGIRRFGTHFAVARDHESPEVDALLNEMERFSTVTKLGEGGRMASATDPRRAREN